MDAELEAIRARHVPRWPDAPTNAEENVCEACDQTWWDKGCDTAQVLARLDAATLEAAQQERFKWAANERADAATEAATWHHGRHGPCEWCDLAAAAMERERALREALEENLPALHDAYWCPEADVLRTSHAISALQALLAEPPEGGA